MVNNFRAAFEHLFVVEIKTLRFRLYLVKNESFAVKALIKIETAGTTDFHGCGGSTRIITR
jgi:hypothetical protein